MKRKLASLLTLVMVLCTCMNSMAATYSLKWTCSTDGNWQAYKYGVLLKNTWILDDECDVEGGLWYLVDENGNLVASPLVKDGEGRYYSFNGTHDGHYGAMLTGNGTYNGVKVTFSQTHDGSYGSITDSNAIASLAAKYGVKEMPQIKNTSFVKLSEVKTTYDNDDNNGNDDNNDSRESSYFTVSYDLGGVDVTATPSYADRRVKGGTKLTKPATPSDVSGANVFVNWLDENGVSYDFENETYYVNEDLLLTAKWNAAGFELSRDYFYNNETLGAFTGKLFFGSYDTYQSEINAGTGVNVDKGNKGTIKLYDGTAADEKYILAEGDATISFPKNCEALFTYADTNDSKFGLTGYKATAMTFNEIDTSSVEKMDKMFYKCSNLASLDVDSFDTSNVTSMSYMFDDCSDLTNLDVSSFNTEKVTSMESMFDGCEILGSLDLSNFNTSNVTNMESMFMSCNGLTSLNVSSFDTANVTNMAFMFSVCTHLTTLDLRSFNTGNVTNMTYMFSGCTNLQTITGIESFNTTKVTEIANMFFGCSGLVTLDLSSFNTGKVIYMNNMFLYCSSLETIYAGTGFTVTAADSASSMFFGCESLHGGNGTPYDDAHVSKEYARLDGGLSAPGYFTLK